MAPNHQVPIEQAGLWDILDWDLVADRAKDASGDPRDNHGRNALAWTAKMLIDAATQAGGEDEKLFHRVFTTYVTAGKEAERRRLASGLAMLLGAKPDRLIEFAAFKWGLFKRTASTTR